MFQWSQTKEVLFEVILVIGALSPWKSCTTQEMKTLLQDGIRVRFQDHTQIHYRENWNAQQGSR